MSRKLLYFFTGLMIPFLIFKISYAECNGSAGALEAKSYFDGILQSKGYGSACSEFNGYVEVGQSNLGDSYACDTYLSYSLNNVSGSSYIASNGLMYSMAGKHNGGNADWYIKVPTVLI